MRIHETLNERKKASEDFISTSGKRNLWTEYESILNGNLGDALSGTAKSQVFDHKLSTQVLERSARVMAQLATGKVKSISKNDEGASKLMNLMLDKYVIPNANAQFDFLTKLRMVDMYSNIYGNYFAMVDWDIRGDGYQGPDLFLLPIRDVFPQVGAVSLEDSDYVIVRTWRPLSYFESLSKDKEFKNIGKIIDILKDKSGGKSKRDADSLSDREKNDSAQEAKGKGYYEVLSMYEKDRWVDYVPEADSVGVIRDIKNPHENGELPVVNKYSIPLIDDFFGMGDFERGKSMQYTANSLWNLYLDAVRVSIFPPVLLDKDKIADQSSIKWAAAAKWLMKDGGAVGGVQTLNLTPQGINTFTQTYNMVTAALMNMFGTTDTATTQEMGTEFGKTPQALKMQASRENSRDNVDRFYMEQFVSKVYRKFVNLMSKKQTGNVAIRMFSEEIDEIAKVHEDIKDMYNENTGKLTINKSKVGSLLYDYEIVSGSTYALDQKQQQENLLQLLNMVANPQIAGMIMQSLQKEQKELRVGELFTRVLSNSGIQDWDKIVVDLKDDPEAATRPFDEQFATMFNQVANMGKPGMENMAANPDQQMDVQQTSIAPGQPI